MRKVTIVLLLSLSLLAVKQVLASPVGDARTTVVPGIGSNPEIPPGLQVTSTPLPTFPFGEQVTGPPLGLTLTLLGMCCVFLVLIGVVILGFVVRRQNREVAAPE